MKMKRFLACLAIIAIAIFMVNAINIFPITDKNYADAVIQGEINAEKLGEMYGKASNVTTGFFDKILTKLGWMNEEYRTEDDGPAQEEVQTNISKFVNAAFKELDEKNINSKPSPGNTDVNKDRDSQDTLIPVTLESVVDGDTLWVTKDGELVKVRLIGIDTPESVHQDETKNNEYGKMASNHTKELLSRVDTVYLQYDVEANDQYGRELCYVWFRQDVDTESMQDVRNYMLNAIILCDGYAYDKVFLPNCEYADFFQQLREEAEETKSGLWLYDEFAALWKN